MVDGGRRVRPHWSRLFQAVSELGSDELRERGRLLERWFVEDGVASLLPGAEPARRLDPIPLIITAAEFARLRVGLTQRARLLDAVLADLHGPMSLLARGLVPPELVYANPAFARAMRASSDDAAPVWPGLAMYAAELIRGPDGIWMVVADRTEDAAGIGYASDNRTAMIRTLPELFATERQLRRLRPFFDYWQDSMRRMAPRVDNPGVAVLSPGPAEKKWFEHVLLAHALSCALVEPDDLTVRDGVVFLKTLRGLRRIDVLLRRQNSRLIDPLELDDPSARGGTPGLLDAARDGAVRIINPPGSGAVEAPGFAAILPALAEVLLSESLLIPSLPTQNLTAAEARAEIFASSGAWTIGSAIQDRAPAFDPGTLDSTARAALERDIAAGPERYAARAIGVPSTAPCAGSSGLVPGGIVLRMFLISDGTDWHVMPGGFARVLPEGVPYSGRLPLHGTAKDVWVLGENELEIAGLAPQTASVLPVRRATGDLPSRVADNFYWLGRYLERAEGAARLLSIAAEWLERPSPTARELAETDQLMACTAAFDLTEAEAVRGIGTSARAVALLAAAANSGPLGTLLAQVSRLAWVLRDRLTGEAHTVMTHRLREVIDGLRALPRGGDGTRGLVPLMRAMTGVLSFSATVSGLATENMVRGGSRLFLDLGRRVERARATATVLAHVLDQPEAALHPARIDSGLRLGLVLCDSVITYQTRYLGTLQPAPVLDLILADEGNPRALAFQLAAARDLLAELDNESPREARRIMPAVVAMLEEVRRIPVEIASSANQAVATARAAPRLMGIAARLATLSDGITAEYFALLPVLHGLEIVGETEQLRGAA
jgi:uncharacterized circularly permuted ATP-grasp superfamily protein/uncharacterized alpha-E superfamily protein